jgi:hypothetical protein
VELLQFLRVAWINNEEDLREADRAFQGPINLQNELQAHVMLSLKLNQAINGYPTKLEVCREGGRREAEERDQGGRGGGREGEGTGREQGLPGVPSNSKTSYKPT